MDDLMADHYKNTLASSRDAGIVQVAQRRWVADRNKCTDIACLVRSYQGRIVQLLPAYERGEPWISGVYKFEDNRLDIIQTKPREVRFRLFAISPSGNMGEVEGTGQLYDGVAKFFNKKNDCNLTFHIKVKTIILSQIGYCGFGLNVSADGDYRHIEQKSPVLREYRLEKGSS